MDRTRLLVPVVALGLLAPACASEEAPIEDPPSNDGPVNSLDDGIDTEVEQQGNLGFEPDEDQ